MDTDPTCCPDNRTLLHRASDTPLVPLSPAEYADQWVFALTKELVADSQLHKVTKGTHSCYLSMEGKLLFSAEDIGRHNAVDKCIGYALLQGLPLHSCMLFTTGRIPTDMVRKAIAAGIPLLVSKAVPTDVAIEMARSYNLTLIGRAWSDGYTLFQKAL